MDEAAPVTPEAPKLNCFGRPGPAFLNYLGRRADRDIARMRERHHRFPPHTKKPGVPTDATLAMLQNHGKARADAAKQGAFARGARARWTPNAPAPDGHRITTDAGGVIAVAIEGITGDKEPLWSALKVGECVQDGTVVWMRLNHWTGRPGYGSLGMRDVCRALRMHPFATEVGDARRKARGAAKRQRQQRAA